MGGYGSGQGSRWGAKDVVEDCLRLDVRYLERAGFLRLGGCFPLSWRRGDKAMGDIVLFAATDHVRLVYRYRRNNGPWQDIDYLVPLEWTPCHYGGRRVWFRCPGVVRDRACRRRVAILYDGGAYFLCRHCYDLAYQSQREDVLDRTREHAQAIRRRLGGTGSLVDPFPEKPRRMHWRTYERLWDHAIEAELRHGWEMDEHILALGAWIQKRHTEKGIDAEDPSPELSGTPLT